MKFEISALGRKECPNFEQLLAEAILPHNRIERLLAQAHFHSCPGCGPSYQRVVGFFDLCRKMRGETARYQTID